MNCTLRRRLSVIEGEEQDGICYTKEELMCLLYTWNSIVDRNDLPNHYFINLNFDPNRFSKKAVIDLLIAALDKVPRKFHSLREELFKSCPSYLEDLIFKPKLSNPYLTANNIMYAMKEFTEMFPYLRFEGVFSADHEYLKTLQIPPLSKKSKWAMILNSAKQGRSGHWIALFKTPYTPLEYYDSEALPVLNSLKTIVSRLNPGNEDILQNLVPDQTSGEQCGIYAISYIIYRALGQYQKTLSESVLPEDKLEQIRSLFFD